MTIDDMARVIPDLQRRVTALEEQARAAGLGSSPEAEQINNQSGAPTRTGAGGNEGTEENAVLA